MEPPLGQSTHTLRYTYVSKANITGCGRQNKGPQRCADFMCVHVTRMLAARCIDRQYTCVTLFHMHTTLIRWVVLLSSFYRGGNRLRGVELLSPVHIARKWQGQGLDPVLTYSRACAFPVSLSWVCCEVLSLGRWRFLCRMSSWTSSCPTFPVTPALPCAES